MKTIIVAADVSRLILLCSPMKLERTDVRCYA